MRFSLLEKANKFTSYFCLPKLSPNKSLSFKIGKLQFQFAKIWETLTKTFHLIKYTNFDISIGKVLNFLLIKFLMVCTSNNSWTSSIFHSNILFCYFLKSGNSAFKNLLNILVTVKGKQSSSIIISIRY